jgi:hypothetical protein
MFIVPLDAAQQAKQVAPQVWVSVQPPAGGMPEWVKLLISAGTGALLGIASNVVMEYVKPWIARRVASQQLKDELTEELTDNLDLMNSLNLYLARTKDDSTVEDSAIFSRAISAAADVTRDRYDYFYEENKIVLHNTPGKKSLIKFYQSIKTTGHYSESNNYRGVSISTESAVLHGVLFLKLNGISYSPKPTVYDAIDEKKPSGFDFKHARPSKPKNKHET